MKTKFTINKGFVIHKVGSSQKIFDPENSCLYTLNTSASFILTKIKEEYSAEEIVEEYCTHFDIPKPKGRTDVKTFLQELLSYKIVY